MDMDLELDTENFDIATPDETAQLNIKDTRSKAQKRLEARRKLEAYQEKQELDGHLNEVWWDLDYPEATD